MSLSPYLDVAFALTVGASALLVLASYVDVHRLVRYTSYPWSYQLGRARDLDFQSIAYVTLHTRGPTRLVHAVSLPLEQVAWAVVLAAVHPALVVAVGVGLGALGLASGERPFAAVAAGAWALVGLVAVALPATVGPLPTVEAAMLLLLVGPWLRVMAHTPEPIPPFVGAEDDRFVAPSEAVVGARLPAVTLLAVLSELLSALPFRLWLVQLYWLAQRLGYRPRGLAWADAAAIGARIRAGGWGAEPRTAAPLSRAPA